MTDSDFEPTKWWRAMKDGELLAETSNPEDLRRLGLLDQEGVVIERMYQRTESKWVRDAPPPTTIPVLRAPKRPPSG